MKAVIAIGSNIGDREQNLNTAVKKISENITNLIISPFIQTKPAGGPEQGDYLNAVVMGECEFLAQDLLNKLLFIENQMGRVRDVKWGPRLIDLDLIIYGDQIISSDSLQLPHPLAHTREFVLSPWLGIDPEGEIPGAGKIKYLLASLDNPR